MSIQTEIESLTPEEKLLLKKVLQDEIYYEEIKKLIFLYPEVPIDEFIDSPQYLGQKETIWPKLKEDLIRIKQGDYRQVFYIGGIGAGKTTEIALLLAYELFELGRKRNPQKFYSLSSGSRIAVMNASIRARQAKDVLFDDLKTFIDGSPWFQKYMKPDPRIKSRLRFPRNIFAIPGNSQETFPIGFNIKTVALDEMAWFLSASHIGDSESPSENLYESYLKRLKSRFKDYLIAILTSPRTLNDMTEKMKDEALKNKEILWIRRPLWKAKPDGYYANQFFVYDETYSKVVAKDVRDILREAFGHVPDGFEMLSIEEIQYLVNLLVDIKPDILKPNVIDETVSVKPPEYDVQVLPGWKLDAIEGISETDEEEGALEENWIPTLEVI